MLKKILTVLSAAGFIFIFCAPGRALANVAVVTNMVSREAEAHKEAFEAFKKSFSDSAQNLDMVQFDLADIGDEAEAVENIREYSLTMIVAFGSRAASLMKENFEDTPVVFSMALNPVGRGLVESMQSSGNNLTGVTLNMPVLPQFRLIKNILPGLENIGVMYDPQSSGHIIEEAQSAATQLGLNLIEQTVREAREISGALDKLREEGADIIWALPDSTVYSGASVRQVLLFSLRNRIPVAGFSESFARAGALVGTYHSNEDIGEQTALLSLKVLAGRAPSNIPLASPREMLYSLNRRVMDNFSIDVNSSIEQDAQQIFE